MSVFIRQKEVLDVVWEVSPDHKLFSVVTECHCRLMSIIGDQKPIEMSTAAMINT